MLGADQPTQFMAVDLRQAGIAEDDVGRLVAERLECLLAGGHRDALVPRRLDRAPQQKARRGVVVGDEYSQSSRRGRDVWYR